MTIRTLSDAVAIVEFLMSRQGLSLDKAIKEASIPPHLRAQLLQYFSPPLDISHPDLIVDNSRQIPKCNPDNDTTQQYFGTWQKFLIDNRSWPKSTVGTLSETSLSIIRRLPKPDASEEFQIRGLVLGYIQSGKTANMAALIARAADEGYKLFIVLSGLWKDLRAQTQRRLDQEITGYSEEPKDAPFVQYDNHMPTWVRLSRSGLDGDFTTGPNDLNPKTIKLAVIKKNSKIETLAKWLKKSPFPIKDLPAIIIDDEADHGSINTNYMKTDDDGEPIDPTATNRRIRDLLKLFPKCVYIGFTATPFANVLIDTTVEEDLYPRDFIVTLPEPPGYFGPRKLFGLGMEPSDLSPATQEKPSLNVIRYVEEEDLDEIDRVLESGSENKSSRILSDALLDFVLSSCSRLARGQSKQHFSMLVHPSQRTEPHRIFANAISAELELLKNAAAYPKKFTNTINRAKERWEDFQKTTREQDDPALEVFDFETIWKFAKELVESIEIKILNTYSSDRLEYDGIPRRYVVVGGNRLSRGLTLEGLSVSVFTRNANQYDTLLQMGRWFGYRPQYYDLTRIFVERTMAYRFAELARVEDDLRADFKKYAQEPDPPTPLQLKPIIRAHRTMAVTSRLKMGAGKRISISFQKQTSETVTFPVRKKSQLVDNIKAAQALIGNLSEHGLDVTDKGLHVWKDVPASKIIEFLNDYEFSREARDVNRLNLVNYLNRQNEHGELLSWDVVLPAGNKKMGLHRWTDGIFTHKIYRGPITPESIAVLSDPHDRETWRALTQRDNKNPKYGCMMLYLIDGKSEKNSVKFFPDPTEAEDIVGLTFVFPESKSHATVEYISQ